ncbi:MAG: T9SS type A sorting domain-containing protein [Bacteroidetes bacterium]|uniref:T9SS type A sorting domain-containing protein n=1 Tax=Candidatus Pullibacteroides excrementavium TaxID=2840905 RepID=A0A9D9GYL3_9BACT|nr:T9SS type A sorting domain-containing protein [Candidatus Pullibacteroides excrementavium]
MKKFFVSTVMVMLGASMVMAQNFTVVINGQEVSDGATVNVEQVVDPNDPMTLFMQAHMQLTNKTDADLTITSTLTPSRELPEGALFSDCTMGSCVMGFDGKEISLASGESTPESDAYDYTVLSGDYESFPIAITYTDNKGYSLNCTLTFVPLAGDSTGTASEKLDRVAISAYPNPTMGEVHFMLANVKAGSKVVLRDMNGRVVESVAVKGETELSMNLEALNAGVYFYSVEENGKAVVTRKLVVR